MASQDKGISARRLALSAVLTLAALLLSYVEALVPTSPFLKLGLANIATTLAVMLISRRAGLAVTVLRVGITSLLFGTVTAFWFSLAGGLLAFTVTAAMKPLRMGERMTLAGISVLSAAAHNIGQVTAACLLLSSTSPLYVLPWLLLASVVTGMLTGIVSEIIYTRIRNHI